MLQPTSSREVLLALDATPAAAAAARHELRRSGLDEDLAHTVLLLTSELVGNAVRHTGAGRADKLVFYARLGEGRVRVEVADPGGGFDPEIRHTASGFGLRLVDRLATDWGVEATGRGCRVWFEVDRRPRPAGRFERADVPDRVRV